MASDAGGAGSVVRGAGRCRRTAAGVKVHVTDPLRHPTRSGYVYLFRQTAASTPAPGSSTSTTSSTCTRRTTRPPTSSDGPNPENSPSPPPTPTTSGTAGRPTAQDHRAGASGVDILDRHKDLFAPGNCGRSEDTFDGAEGAFIANKGGPVRAIRSYIGANSGPHTSARTSSTRAARTSSPTCGCTRSAASWTSSTTARPRPA